MPFWILDLTSWPRVAARYTLLSAPVTVTDAALAAPLAPRTAPVPWMASCVSIIVRVAPMGMPRNMPPTDLMRLLNKPCTATLSSTNSIFGSNTRPS